MEASRALNSSCKLLLVAALVLLPSLSTSAEERAVLRNGATIRHERREVRSDMTRLYLAGAEHNYIDVPTDDIVGFEEVQSPTPPVVSAAPEEVLDVTEHAPVDLQAVVSAASNRNNINPDLIYSMIRVESGFNPNAISRKGAQGLMQLMPETAARLGVVDPLDPVANVDGGTRYLRELLARYNNDLIKALAAYNAGPERVEKFNGVPPYPETISYVARVIRDFNSKKTVQPRQLPPLSPRPRGRQQTSKSLQFPAPGQEQAIRSSAMGHPVPASAGS